MHSAKKVRLVCYGDVCDVDSGFCSVGLHADSGESGQEIDSIFTWQDRSLVSKRTLQGYGFPTIPVGKAHVLRDLAGEPLITHPWQNE